MGVDLTLDVSPSTLTLQAFGQSVAIQAKKLTALNNAAHVNIPVLVKISVKKPDNTMQTVEQKRILFKDVYKLYGHYTPKMAGEHTVYVVISDQVGNELAQQAKMLTVILNNDGDGDSGNGDGDDWPRPVIIG